MSNYEKLSVELTERMKHDIANNTRPQFARDSASAIRRDPSSDLESIWRPAKPGAFITFS